jgi:UDP-glucose 4-epimerase
LAKAHVKSCDRLIQRLANEKYEVYNIGTGNGYSVLEIINAFEQYNNLKLNYTLGTRRAGDAAAMYAAVSKAETYLHWKAEQGLKEMVTSAWHWQQKLTEAV